MTNPEGNSGGIDRRNFVVGGAAAALGAKHVATTRPSAEAASAVSATAGLGEVAGLTAAASQAAQPAFAAQVGTASSNDQRRRIVDLIGARNIKAFIQLDSVDPVTGYVHDKMNPQLQFRVWGNAQVGAVQGLLGPATKLNDIGDYLEEVPHEFEYTFNDERWLATGSTIFAQRIEPTTMRLITGAMRVRREGNMSSAIARMTLRDDAGGQPGDVLSASDPIACANIRNNWNWLGFNFSNPRDMVRTVGTRHPNPGNSLRYYWLCIEYSDGSGVDGSNYLRVRNQTASTYGNPRAEFNGSWTVSPGEHFAFALLSDHLQLPQGHDASIIAIAKLDPFINPTKLDSNAVFTQRGPVGMAFEVAYFRGNRFHMDLNDGRNSTRIPMYDSEWNVFGLTHESAATSTFGYVNGNQRVSHSKDPGTTLQTQTWLTSIGAALYLGLPGGAQNAFQGAIDSIIVTKTALTADQHADIAAIARFG